MVSDDIDDIVAHEFRQNFLFAEMYSHLQILPDSLVNSLFQDWLNFYEVTNLDTSFTNFSQRDWFLSVISHIKESEHHINYIRNMLTNKDQYCHHIDKSEREEDIQKEISRFELYHRKYFYAWVSLRKIRLRKIKFNIYDRDHIWEYPVNTELVRSLTFDEVYGTGFEAGVTVINACTNLEKLRIEHTYPAFNDVVSPNISPAILNQLTHFYSSLAMVPAIVNHFKSLVALSLSHSINQQFKLNDVCIILDNNPHITKLRLEIFGQFLIEPFVQHLTNNCKHEFSALLITHNSHNDRYYQETPTTLMSILKLYSQFHSTLDHFRVVDILDFRVEYWTKDDVECTTKELVCKCSMWLFLQAEIVPLFATFKNVTHLRVDLYDDDQYFVSNNNAALYFAPQILNPLRTQFNSIYCPR